MFSCSTRPVAKPAYYAYYNEEQLHRMREKGHAEAQAYFRELETRPSDSVKMLSLNWTFLDTLPDFSNYNKVEIIDFCGNEIEIVDKSLFTSDSLRIVTLDKCCIRQIEFPEGNHIERLNLTNNQLDHIPVSIRRCKYLKELNLEGNQIRHIPRWIMELDSLEEINLNFNQLKLRMSDIRHLVNAKQLLLVGNGIDRLPSNIGRLRCESLNLAKNELHALPKSFAKMKQLNSLIFYENEFEDIPEVLNGLNHIKHLDFYKNHVKEIPEFVGNMENLEQLFLSFNNIKEIPDTLRNLKRLKYFYIHHNELHFLPEWITEMDSIERFGISFNHLLELPDLSKMTSLKDFNCEHNLLEHFPWELLEKPNMEMINARDNDFILSEEEEMRLIKANKTFNVIY